MVELALLIGLGAVGYLVAKNDEKPVENFVSGELQDKKYGLAGSNLTGHLINQKGERKNIKVNLGGSFKIDCTVFIDDKELIVEKIK